MDYLVQHEYLFFYETVTSADNLQPMLVNVFQLIAICDNLVFESQYNPRF